MQHKRIDVGSDWSQNRAAMATTRTSASTAGAMATTQTMRVSRIGEDVAANASDDDYDVADANGDDEGESEDDADNEDGADYDECEDEDDEDD